MSTVKTETNAELLAFLETHAVGDYQQYLERYIDDYAARRAAQFSAAPGKIFLEREPELRALAKVVALDWDSRCLGFKAARIDPLAGEETASLQRVLEKVKRHARQESIKLLSCRLAYRDVTALHALEAAGFRLVDAMNILLWDRRWGLPHEPEVHAENLGVEPLAGGDEPTRRALYAIARTAFRHGRVANDPAFTGEQVGHFYESLFSSCLDNATIRVLVARLAGRPAGFAMYEQEAPAGAATLTYLKLIAVDNNFAGLGVGKALLYALLQNLDQRVRFMEVGTQIDNYAALNLYVGCGLKLFSSLVTFHLWL